MRRLFKAKYLDINVVRSRKTNIISDTRLPTWGTSQEGTFHGRIMAQKMTERAPKRTREKSRKGTREKEATKES